MRNSTKKYQIIYAKYASRLKAHEYSAACILARELRENIIVLPRSTIHTPDFKINNEVWELKSSMGKSKKNIEHLLHQGMKQSPNLVIDLRKTKMDHRTAINRTVFEFNKMKAAKKLIIITREEKTISVQKSKKRR